MRLCPKRRWRAPALGLACCALVALSPVPLPKLIKDADAVVVGKLEITREQGITITWYPELKGQEKATKRFHIGRIRVSKVLRKRAEFGHGYDVAFDSSWPYTNATQSIWLLRWNSLLGRYALSEPYPNSLAEVEKAIAEVEKEEKR